MSFLSPPKAPTPPPTPAPPAPFITQTKPAKKASETPTFLGAEKTPSTDVVGTERGKTLLGQ